ncbi:MAG: hypothetical protein M3O20_07520 [Acidobacteriota bacterium]|nr:hypothetical protein [Acidobacteriota bacterium]
MITATSPVTTPAPELTATNATNTSAAACFAEQLASVGTNASSTTAVPQDAFLQYFLGAASAATPSSAATTDPAPEISTLASTSTSSAAPSVNATDAPQDTPAYNISSTPPYFTPAPDQYTTVTPTSGMVPFQADSMDSYLQKFIGQSVSDMYGFISGTQSWANGGSAAITDNFVSMVQQRITAYPSMGEGIDPQAMGTQYANVFMKVLSSVQVSQLGSTNFNGSVLDFLNQGGSPEPTALNQVPAVMNT